MLIKKTTHVVCSFSVVWVIRAAIFSGQIVAFKAAFKSSW